jgi:hypothetical protein
MGKGSASAQAYETWANTEHGTLYRVRPLIPAVSAGEEKLAIPGRQQNYEYDFVAWDSVIP